ncbi:oligoribonuclease [Nitrosospira briensis]|uniref:Oligoribonuclease n=1 Tax=Nitrosospira briensis TaxID=35799 RepID=A0A1I5A1D8_9PROT|nr:oligoribonuclease [Nitrosospira briensis]SFN56207.1 oligoribonuclease [Nitrosospira briensis]
MSQESTNLIWIDMEMSGLSPETDQILEVALVITDSQLNILAEAPVLVLFQPEVVLDGMDNWNKSTHSRSGLIDKVRASSLAEAQAESLMIEFLQEHIAPGVSPMCGNSICQDRRFLARRMPRLEAYFHYRNLDVSSLKELVKRWRPEILPGLTKQCKHEALADIHDSIVEMRYYREHFIKA